MKIYVAGEVPRPPRPMAALKSRFGLSSQPSAGSLTKIYLEIKAALAGLGFSSGGDELKLPYPNPTWDSLEPKDFVARLRETISESDAVLTVFFPPGIAVAFEALLAAELRKPQIILVPEAIAIPRYLRTLPNVVNIYELENVEFSNVLGELTASFQKEAEGVEYA
jgi:hypothetical protein